MIPMQSEMLAEVVGQTSRSARVLQDPLFARSTNRPAWTPAAGLESCPTI
jgi:hypothetical protein